MLSLSGIGEDCLGLSDSFGKGVALSALRLGRVAFVGVTNFVGVWDAVASASCDVALF